MKQKSKAGLFLRHCATEKGAKKSAAFAVFSECTLMVESEDDRFLLSIDR